MHNEVIVIGLGAAGSYAAWQLAERGVRVVGLEGDDLLHTRGAYAGESRLFRAAYHEGAEYVPLLLESRAAWRELEQQGRRRIFHPTGVLSIGPADAPQMAQVQQSLTHAEIAHEVFTTAQLAERFPQHAELTNEIGVLDLLGGVLRPESAVAEIQRRARAAGAELLGGQRVVEIQEEPAGVTAVLADGSTRTAEQVIVTAGVYVPALLPQLAPHLSIRPINLSWFCPEDPEVFSPARFPAFIRDLGGLHLFGAPTLDDSLVKVGYDAKFGTIASPAQLPTSLSDEMRAEIVADVHRLIPQLPPYIARESMHMDIYTEDKRPVLGRLSKRIVVGTGFSGHGFKLTPAFGNALAALVWGEAPAHDLSRFSPERFIG